MIINAGGRTDLVNYFTTWLLYRFEKGEVLSRNPFYPNIVMSYKLHPSVVDCVVMCSKNYFPILKDLHRIYDRFNIFCNYTITAYGKDIEPNVPDIEESINTLKLLCRQTDKEKIVWRYDPVLFTPYYTVEQHCRTFDYISRQLSGYINYCVFSFVDLYQRVTDNIPNIIIPNDDMKEMFCRKIGEIAKKNGIRIQTCATVRNYSQSGIGLSGCVTSKILTNALNVKFQDIKHSGIRKNCRCLPMRDIGAYNTCPNGCKYCYANTKPYDIKNNLQKHDPYSPLLIGTLSPDDIIKPAVQTSFLSKEKSIQKTLF